LKFVQALGIRIGENVEGDADDGGGTGVEVNGVLVADMKRCGKAKGVAPLGYNRLKNLSSVMLHQWLDGNVREDVLSTIDNIKDAVTWKAEVYDNREEETPVPGVEPVDLRVDWACETYPEFHELWYSIDIQFRSCVEPGLEIEKEGNLETLLRSLPIMYLQQVYHHRYFLARVTANFMSCMHMMLSDTDKYSHVLVFFATHCKSLFYDGIIEHVNS